MKKLKVLLLMVILTFTLSGCGLDFSDISSETKVIDAKYGLSLNEVESYTEYNPIYAATTVANIVMPATLEISCKINFTYDINRWNGAVTTSDSVSSTATGFIINEDGYIITNAHVITISSESSYRNLKYTNRDITVNFADSNKVFSAEIVEYDVDLDLAILKMDPTEIKNFQYVTLFNLTDPDSEEYDTADAVKLYYGEYVIAIGNANGYGIAVTQGVVSAPVRYFEEESNIILAIQTDAAINPGNSGGPLCNAYGAVIGVNSFKIVTSSSENLGYAIPSNVIISYIDSCNEELSTNIKYYLTTERAYIS